MNIKIALYVLYKMVRNTAIVVFVGWCYAQIVFFFAELYRPYCQAPELAGFLTTPGIIAVCAIFFIMYSEEMSKRG